MKQRLIDATQIENKIAKWVEELSHDFDDRDELNGVYSCLAEIQSAPTIDPESLRPHGKWEDACYYHDRPLCYECSNCGLKLMYKPNYCPNCGAKMEINNEESI